MRDGNARMALEAQELQVAALGDRIALVRKLAGWGQTKLAKEVGVTRGAVGQWEMGKTQPTSSNLGEIAVKAGVDYDWLATGRGYAPTSVLAGSPRPPSGIVIKVELTIISERTPPWQRLLRAWMN